MQEIKYEVVLMIISMEHSYLDTHSNNSKHGPIFGIFDPIIGERQWYDKIVSQALKCICELFGNITFFHSMK